MNIAQFRQAFPEFSDTARYPDAQITFWSGWATLMINPNKFGTMTTNAIYLYTAHEISLAAQNVSSGQSGGVPGTGGGVAQSKTVGSVSVTYDSLVTSEKNAGFYNLTNYGKQLWRLIRMFGAGGVQL